MSFDIILLASVFALSAMVPLENAAAKDPTEKFDQGYIEDGVLTQYKDQLEVTINITKNGNFGSSSAASLNVLQSTITLKAWDVINLGSLPSAGEKQYITDGFYDFQAILLNLYRNQDIRPSFWHLFDCTPKKIYGGSDVFDTEQKVSNWEYITYIRGVVDKDTCYGTVTKDQCPVNCPLDANKLVFANSYGKGLLLKSVTSLDDVELKQKIANYGPVLVSANGVTTRLYYGWNSQGFIYLYRDSTTGALIKDRQSQSIGSIYKAYYAYQAFNCDETAKLDKKVLRTKCECPPESDQVSYKLDKRSATKKFCTTIDSGSTRAAFAVIATVILLPVLTMW